MSDQNIEEARKVLLDRGKEVMDGIAGNGAADSTINAQSEFTKPAYEYLMGSCFASIWDRDGLEKKYRSLTVISILAAKGNIPQLKSHVKMGLSNGLKEEEIRECLLHVMGYCGFPAGLDAFAAADEVINASKA